MHWDTLFTLGFFVVLAVAGLAVAYQKADTPLLTVTVEAQVDLPEKPISDTMEAVQAAVDGVHQEAADTLRAYRQFAEEAQQKLKDSESVFQQLEQAALLLQGEAQAVSDFGNTARVLLWASVILLGLAALLTAAQLWVMRSMLVLMAAYSEVDLRQQASLWEAIRRLLPRRSNGNGHKENV